MAIGLRGVGTISVNTTSPSPTYPASVAVTDISVLTVVAKPKPTVLPQDVVLTTPSGWTKIFEGNSGNEPPNNPVGNSGSDNMWIFIRTGGNFSGSVPLTFSSANVSIAGAGIVTYTGSGTYSTATVFGYDNDSSGNPFNSNNTVASTNLGLVGGDFLVVCSGFTGSNGVDSPVVTATGCTLPASTQRVSSLTQITSPSTSTAWIDVRDLTVTSGTETAGPVMALTNVTDGICVFVRIREGNAAISVGDTVSSAENSGLGAQLSLPATKTWNNGDPMTASTLNASLRDPISWLMTDSPGIQLRKTSEPNLTSSPYTVDWDTIDYRRGSMTVSGTKVSVPTTGVYIGEFQVGVKDIGTMTLGWLLTVDVLMYPGGVGTPNVHNVSVNFTDMDVEQSFTVGSIPFMVYLNQGDAIEVRMSGSWGTSGTALWATSDPLGVAVRLDLHWYAMWDGVSR